MVRLMLWGWAQGVCAARASPYMTSDFFTFEVLFRHRFTMGSYEDAA